MKLDTCLLGSLSQDIVIKGCSVAKCILTLCDLMDCQASLSFIISRSLLKLMSIKFVMPSNHLIHCRHLLLLPSVFPSIRVFSNESVFASGSQSIWRRKWQPTPVFWPGESQGWGSLVGCRLWGHTESDTTEVT